MAFFWLLFVAVDLACGWIAFRMDGRERRFPALLLIAQRFVYRQLMYWVVIRAVSAALQRPLGRLGQARADRAGDGAGLTRIGGLGAPHHLDRLPT